MIEVIIEGTVGVAAGIVYGTLWYARAYRQDGDEFNPAKFGGTLLVAGAVGLAFGVSGAELTQANIMAAIAANTAAIALLEPILKLVFGELGWFPQYAE